MLNINPNKFVASILYVFSFGFAVYALSKILIYILGDGTIDITINPYIYALIVLIPVLAFGYYAASPLAKNGQHKIKIYIISFYLLMIAIFTLEIDWVTKISWWLLEKIPNFDYIYSTFPELFPPAIKTLALSVPFTWLFLLGDYIIGIYRDDYIPVAIEGFKGFSLTKDKKENVAFSCGNTICTEAITNKKIIIPEKKRFEATLVQGATGSGKTAMVLLPMSARDAEKKMFFREYSKKLGYSLLQKGIAYINGPFTNDYINKYFTMSYLKPRTGKESAFYKECENIIHFHDPKTDEIVYKDLGITVVENDGQFIDNFIAVAKNMNLDVMSVDPANAENTLSINPFAIPEPSKAASIIADVLKSMYENDGGKGPSDPFFTQVTMDAFQNLAILLKEMYPILNNGEIASLEDMLDLLYNFDKVEIMSEEMKKLPELAEKYKLLIAYFERNFYKPTLNINGFEIPGNRGSGRKDTERFLYGAITQLNNLMRHPGLKKALCGKNNLLNFDKALEAGSVITACSRKGDLGIIQAKAFGMFFILQFQDAVLRRGGNEDTRIPHFLYIDEFPEYINKDMEVIFTLFRKYRCGTTIAIQNLSQLDKAGGEKGQYKQTILSNTRTQLIYGDTVPEDSDYWEKAFGKTKIPYSMPEWNEEASGADMGRKVKIIIRKKERIEAYKLQDLAFGSCFFKTKNDKGKTIYGQGKTSFLDKKYKSKFTFDVFDFEKYMMSKPTGPTIITNSSDTNSDDSLFGSSIASKLNMNYSNSDINQNVLSDNKYANINSANHNALTKNVEIDFESLDSISIQNSKRDGGAITEDYENAIIKKKK